MVTKDYVSLHPEYGGPAKGFRCEFIIEEEYEINGHPCSKVTRTEAGMKMHLLRRHGIRIQGELFEKQQSEQGEIQQETSELSAGMDEGISQAPRIGDTIKIKTPARYQGKAIRSSL